MNIFYLDPHPRKCAEFHADKHCVKMILEYSQLLSTAHRIIDGVEESVAYTPIKIADNITVKKEKVMTNLSLQHIDAKMDNTLYRQTHINHPSAIWVRESSANYQWLTGLLTALLYEYEYRYEKRHKCWNLYPYLVRIPRNIKFEEKHTHPTPAMPDEYVVDGDSVASYRAYYNGAKRHLFAWKNREVPDFIEI